MTDGVRIFGYKELRKELKQLDGDAPKLLNRAIKASLTDSVLPLVKARTPVSSGRLRARTRVAAAGSNIAIANSLPYSNSIHWGRWFWPNKDSPKAVRSVVRGVPFIWDTVEQERPRVLDDIRRALDESINQVTGT